MSYNISLYIHYCLPLIFHLQLLYKLSSGFERDSVEHLVNYAYTGRLEVPDPMVKAVFIAARRLKVSGPLVSVKLKCVVSPRCFLYFFVFRPFFPAMGWTVTDSSPLSLVLCRVLSWCRPTKYIFFGTQFYLKHYSHEPF